MNVLEDVSGVKSEVPISVGKILANGGNNSIGADTGQGFDTIPSEQAVVFVEPAKDHWDRRIHLEQPCKYHHQRLHPLHRIVLEVLDLL